jgi:hypothetical protein
MIKCGIGKCRVLRSACRKERGCCGWSAADTAAVRGSSARWGTASCAGRHRRRKNSGERLRNRARFRRFPSPSAAFCRLPSASVASQPKKIFNHEWTPMNTNPEKEWAKMAHLPSPKASVDRKSGAPDRHCSGLLGLARHCSPFGGEVFLQECRAKTAKEIGGQMDNQPRANSQRYFRNCALRGVPENFPGWFLLQYRTAGS